MTMTPWTPERIDRMREMIELGHSSRDVAKELDTTRNAVIGKMRRLANEQLKLLCLAAGIGQVEHKPSASRPITIFELERGMCATVLPEKYKGRPTYCGRPTLSEKSFCKSCYERYYINPLRRMKS